jgi:hypothetical protein
MNFAESFRIHKAVEYIKQTSFIDDGFNWDVEDIESDELGSVLAHYGIMIDSFSQEGVGILRNELVGLAEETQTREMVRIYAEA